MKMYNLIHKTPTRKSQDLNNNSVNEKKINRLREEKQKRQQFERAEAKK